MAILVCAVQFAPVLSAQEAGKASVSPPEFPEVMARDDQGHATMRAVRLTRPLKIDGRLDEEVYATIRGATDFAQLEPVP